MWSGQIRVPLRDVLVTLGAWLKTTFVSIRARFGKIVLFLFWRGGDVDGAPEMGDLMKLNFGLEILMNPLILYGCDSYASSFTIEFHGQLWFME